MDSERKRKRAPYAKYSMAFKQEFVSKVFENKAETLQYTIDDQSFLYNGNKVNYNTAYSWKKKFISHKIQTDIHNDLNNSDEDNNDEDANPVDDDNVVDEDHVEPIDEDDNDVEDANPVEDGNVVDAVEDDNVDDDNVVDEDHVEPIDEDDNAVEADKQRDGNIVYDANIVDHNSSSVDYQKYLKGLVDITKHGSELDTINYMLDYENLKYTAIPVKPDGHCFFSALLRGLPQHKYRTVTLFRQAIKNHLLTYTDYFVNFFKEKKIFTSYLVQNLLSNISSKDFADNVELLIYIIGKLEDVNIRIYVVYDEFTHIRLSTQTQIHENYSTINILHNGEDGTHDFCHYYYLQPDS